MVTIFKQSMDEKMNRQMSYNFLPVLTLVKEMRKLNQTFLLLFSLSFFKQNINLVTGFFYVFPGLYKLQYDVSVTQMADNFQHLLQCPFGSICPLPPSPLIQLLIILFKFKPKTRSSHFGVRRLFSLCPPYRTQRNETLVVKGHQYGEIVFQNWNLPKQP